MRLSWYEVRAYQTDLRLQVRAYQTCCYKLQSRLMMKSFLQVKGNGTGAAALVPGECAPRRSVGGGGICDVPVDTPT